MKTGPKGERHLCGACGQWHEPHRPDNCTPVPICEKCWRQASVNAKLFALTLGHVSSCISGLDNSVIELLDGVTSAFAASQKNTIQNENN